MIQEVIVVEGKRDVAAVQRSVEAECIVTGGYALPDPVIRRIRQAYVKRGIIILTDPDHAGERIRRRLAQLFPQAKHAFIARAEAQAAGDIGVERATAAVIRQALEKVRYHAFVPQTVFDQNKLLAAGLLGERESAVRRERLGDLLGIGYANAKQFLHRLNHYGVTETEFHAALAELARERRADHAASHCP